MNARLRPLGFRPVDLQPAESGQILAGDIVELDGRRGMAAQNATGMRRQLAAVEADHAALRRARTNWSTFSSPRLGLAGMKPWPRPAIF